MEDPPAEMSEPSTPVAAARDSRPRRRKLAAWKLIVFASFTTALFFGVLEGMLALARVRPVIETEDPYVGFVTNIPLYVEERQPDSSVLLVTAKNKLAYFNMQSFPKAKPAGAYRIFALGGSTTYGHPYDDRSSFTGWLRRILPVVDPSRTWEVVNAGGVSYASYRVANVMQELAHYQPDLFIVYTGQNEFLERRTYPDMIAARRGVNWLGALVARTRTYAVVRAGVHKLRPTQQEKARQSYKMTGEVDALLDAIGGLQAYTRDDTLQSRIRDHFQFNLQRMVHIARDAGTDIVFVNPASNLKDCSPFKSEHASGLAVADLQRFDVALERATAAQESGDLRAARAALEEAVRIDPRHAEAHYRLGRVQLAQGDPQAAQASFQRALDEDVCPLRQPATLADAMREAAHRERVPLVDFASIVADSMQAAHGYRIPGQELFLDHVHPTIEGNRILAVALVEQMIAAGDVHPAAQNWQEEAVRVAREDIESQLDARMQATGLRNVARVFSWAGKMEEADRLAQQALQLDPSGTDSYVVLGNNAAAARRVEEAVNYYELALQANPNDLEARNNLAVELSRAGKYEEAIVHYEELLRARPDQPAVTLNLANAYMQLGRSEEAIRHYTRLVELRPEDAPARSDLGLALFRAGRVAEAMARYREALQIDPKHSEARLQLAAALAQQGKTAESMVELREAVRLDVKNAAAHRALGTALWEQGQPVEAKAELEEALRLDPSLPGVRNSLGLVLWRQGKIPEAIENFSEELRLNPNDPDARDNHAFVLAAQGRTAEAIDEYREALRLRPEEPKTLNALAWLLATHYDARFRDGREALKLATRANELTNHRHPAALNTLAAAYAETGRFEDAVETAQKASAAARQAGQEAMVREIERLIALYQSGKPFHQPRR